MPLFEIFFHGFGATHAAAMIAACIILAQTAGMKGGRR